MREHSEKRGGKIILTEKKVIMFIVEGPSDEAALGTIMKEIFAQNHIRFIVVRGDITTKNDVSPNNVVNKIYDMVKLEKDRYRYRTSDFSQIIHIVDTDGVFIPDDMVVEHDNTGTLYYTDHIATKNINYILRRNDKKRKVLLTLERTTKINSIPYRIYYNSCNLEHVLYNELRDISDEEKQVMSDDFAEKYEGRSNEFKDFISNTKIASPGKYKDTWRFIKEDVNSLNRHSNMHLIFSDEQNT